jgi:ATP-dependent Lon protease
MKENGLTERQLALTGAAIARIIEEYTREAGVRELERQIAGVCRAVAALVAKGKVRRRTVDARQVSVYLGPTQYEPELAQRTSIPGVATGLFYTPAGGGVLFVEATRFPGHGNLTLTGQIGEVMRESAQAAFSLVRSWAEALKIDPKALTEVDVHVHVPAGAVPKDGPSAGLAMATALVSLFRNIPIRPDVAMTGEITLRGLVLPIGGVKQKVLAAKAAGIKTVILPVRNRKDLTELTSDVRQGLKFVFVSKVTQALQVAMDREEKPHRARAARAARRAAKATPR